MCRFGVDLESVLQLLKVENVARSDIGISELDEQILEQGAKAFVEPEVVPPFACDHIACGKSLKIRSNFC